MSDDIMLGITQANHWGMFGGSFIRVDITNRYIWYVILGVMINNMKPQQIMVVTISQGLGTWFGLPCVLLWFSDAEYIF